MSTQKGNTCRSRPQKYQNHFGFKNNLHDTSPKTKIINNLQITNVCRRCKQIIEWKIKYKKYKHLKAPTKCNKCEQKTVKHAYHTTCNFCSKKNNVCPKCGKEADLVVPLTNEEQQLKSDTELHDLLRKLSERKRRTFVRYINKQRPGPKYMLKPLIGFDNHDPSRQRNPAFSMKFRGKSKVTFISPGPYPVPGKITQQGLQTSPAYTIASKSYKKIQDKKPGPGAYAPERVSPIYHQHRAAAYTMIFRHDKIPNQDGPGPIYMLPSSIGPAIPDLRSEGAYSMSFKHKLQREHFGPGPAAYSIHLNTYKRRNPAYTMKFRHSTTNHSKTSPGPKYSYNLDIIKNRQPKYSFGVKYSECTTVGLVEID